ncbi:hypothetical protein FHU41_000154 [Psychromicrobium silvestre]|uniref:Uncharacterized protein n=1 Tax=Psychromicrobium silvestre TaxID=1645614 RepID=A0A7Y9S3L8_9MICC|nr:hypothetical protein [Psychromicrobium silvestre]NYE93933.1 hypothetical protein [Psychromicrobium silvestre]
MRLDHTVAQAAQLLASRGLAEVEQNEDRLLYRRNFQEFEEKS